MSGTDRIQPVLELIEANLAEEISMADLAEVAGCSPSHLCRLFMGCLGRPPMEYLRLRRLHGAVDELAGGRRLTDLALDSGFETQAGFYKAFQRHFGCSPTRYRQHKLGYSQRQFDPALRAAAEGAEQMEEQVVIRLVQESDVEDLWENIFSANTLNEVRERTAGNLQAYAEGQALFLVAEANGHVVGTLRMAFNRSPWGPHLCELNDLVVNPAFQRRGLARRLLEECKVRAAEKGIQMITVGARGGTPPEEVYRHLGFVEYGRLPGGMIEPWGNHDVYDEVMFYMPVTESG